MRRVVVTGLGVISALGRDRAAFGSALRSATCGIRPFQLPDAGRLRFNVAAAVENFVPEDHFNRQELHLMDRVTQFGALAGREAFAHSGLATGGAWTQTGGCLIGCCVGGQTTVDDGFVAIYRHGKTNVSPFTVPRAMANAAASQITTELRLRGPAFAVSSACASSNHAIGLAFQMVRTGAADVMFAGGTEAPLSFGHLKAWEALRVVAPDTCRPFSIDRRGMVLGEGAAMLVLESLDHALARGAAVHGELIGFGMSSDAGHITQPTVDGAVQAMRRALADASIAPESVSYVNAHGTGTKVNDVIEARAIRLVFGPAADLLPVSSTKSIHGHTLGAAGAMEAVATLIGLEERFLPPTLNFTAPDPECLLDVVPNEARPADLDIALSNNFAFGGLNAVLVFRRWPGA